VTLRNVKFVRAGEGMKGYRTILSCNGGFKDNGKLDSVPPPRAASSRTAPGSVRMVGSLPNPKLQVLLLRVSMMECQSKTQPCSFQLINGPFLCLTALTLMYFPNGERFRMIRIASRSF